MITARTGVKACTKALKYKLSANDNSNLFFQRGIHWYGQRKISNALADFEKSIAYNPKNVSAHYNKGGMEELQGKHSEALRSYRRSAELDSSYRLARQGVQRMLAKMKREKPATKQPVAAAPSIQKQSGWCQVWSGNSLVDQEKCIEEARCGEESGEICDLYYQWPSGNRTHVLAQDGQFDAVNGKRAKTQMRFGAPCALNLGSGNTFCFTQKRQHKQKVIAKVVKPTSISDQKRPAKISSKPSAAIRQAVSQNPCSGFTEYDGKKFKNMSYQQIKGCMDAGLSPNATDIDGFSILMLVGMGNPDPRVVQMLIDYGGDVNFDDDGKSVLYMTARFNRGEVGYRKVKMLVDAGAKLTEFSRPRYDPFKQARGQTKMFNYMVSARAGCPGWGEVEFLRKMTSELVVSCTEKGLAVDTYADNGFSVLQNAILVD